MDINKKNIVNGVIVIIVASGIFGAGFYVGQKQVLCPILPPSTVDFSLFWDAYNKLHENFISPETITDQKIMYGAIEGMTNSLNDPYTAFFNPQEAKTFQQDLAGSFDGIGVEVGVKKGQLTIIAPLNDMPGEKAGLKAGDIIVKIDGKTTADVSIDQAVALIRGKKGTSVTLTIFRDGFADTKDITIVRDTIKVDSINWEMKEGNVAYISIHQFDQSLSADFKKVAFEVVSGGAKKIVLDLRNNPGGYLEVSQEIAGWFLSPDQVVTIEDFGKSKEQQIYKAQGSGAFARYPIVVLINRGSASASEILAGALRDNRGVQLVGEKSFGKGSVQEVIGLRDNKSFLKVTIAKWLTPKGISISEVGLAPDVKIEVTESDSTANKDPQLEKALEIIKGLE